MPRVQSVAVPCLRPAAHSSSHTAVRSSKHSASVILHFGVTASPLCSHAMARFIALLLQLMFCIQRANSLLAPACRAGKQSLVFSRRPPFVMQNGARCTLACSTSTPGTEDRTAEVPQQAAAAASAATAAAESPVGQGSKRQRTPSPDGSPSTARVRKPKPVTPPKPKIDRSNLLVIGLGNPGDQYTMTRHNIGFLVADELSRRWGVDMRSQNRFEGVYGSGRYQEKSVGLLKPTTFMNLSGQSGRKAIDFFKLTPGHVLVLADDVALDYGTLKLKPKGGAGGHNGLKSMQSHLKTQEYARLRIGVGAPKRDLVEHVLGEFSKAERKDLDMFVAEAASVVEHWIREDSTDIVMTAANGKKAA